MKSKKEYYLRLIQILQNLSISDKDELMYFLKSQILIIDNKAQSDKERAKEKNLINQKWKERIFSHLDDTPRTLDFLSNLFAHELTRGQLVSKLTLLIEDNKIEKLLIRDEKNKIKTAYKRKE